MTLHGSGKDMIIANKDAFSSGQIGSKIWLCEELEKLQWSSGLTQIYAGWYGITAFLLLSRGNFKVDQIQSFDIDPACEPVADTINENWVWQSWKFKAYTLDCNGYVRGAPDLIINTSTEHFESKEWFENIRSGTRVILQGNDMIHNDHYVSSASADEFAEHYPLSDVAFLGEKLFVYPDWQFTRYMLIGTK
jgi:hypothetical protein